MDGKDLWQIFTSTGRVEDYLRYRGVPLSGGENVKAEGGADHGKRPETTFDDRGTGPAGI